MTRLILRILTALQLTRLTMAFGAVSDIWFVILYSRASPAEHEAAARLLDMPLWLSLLAGAGIAIGLFACGAAMNDVLDFRHDLTFSPQRPIPAGRIRVGQAMIVALFALILAVVCGVILGPLPLYMTLFTAAGIVFYNAAGKHIPAVGIVVIGLLHVTHMLIPNPQLRFTLPIWLSMTNAIGLAATVHILEDKRPRLTLRALIGVVAGWVFWSAALLVWCTWRDGWDTHVIRLPGVLWPVGAILVGVWVLWWKAIGRPRAVAAEKLKRYGALWQCIFGLSWMLAIGHTNAVLVLAGLAVAGFLSMTIIKEFLGQGGRPLGYRA